MQELLITPIFLKRCKTGGNYTGAEKGFNPQETQATAPADFWNQQGTSLLLVYKNPGRPASQAGQGGRGSDFEL